VLAFSAPIPYRDHPESQRESFRAAPGPNLAGCSTDGEILDTSIRDDTMNGLPADSRLMSFFSPGERSSQHGGACGLHDQTMMLSAIGEDP